MIGSWVIDRPNPLKTENLIILADPQRRIRVGARAVDGWAKERKERKGPPMFYHPRNVGSPLRSDQPPKVPPSFRHSKVLPGSCPFGPPFGPGRKRWMPHLDYYSK